MDAHCLRSSSVSSSLENLLCAIRLRPMSTIKTAETAVIGQRTAPPLLLFVTCSRRLSPQCSVTSASTAKNVGTQQPTDQVTSLIA